MNSESFLRREAYIRYAGILLTLSPLGNFFWSSALSGIHHWWQPHTMWMIAKSVSGVLWFLWTSAFLAGVMMLKGKRSSWTFTLCIIGMNVVFGIISYKRDWQSGWFQPTLSLIVNMCLFALIYTQEFHQRLEKKLREARNRPFTLAFKYELRVDFEGLGPWARITEISNTGIRLQSIDGFTPLQIESRTVELALTPHLVLRARFVQKVGTEFIFRFTNMNTVNLALLYRWAQRAASKGTVASQKTAA
jgi:hypothetical protein